MICQLLCAVTFIQVKKFLDSHFLGSGATE